MQRWAALAAFQRQRTARATNGRAQTVVLGVWGRTDNANVAAVNRPFLRRGAAAGVQKKRLGATGVNLGIRYRSKWVSSASEGEGSANDKETFEKCRHFLY